MLLHAPSRGPYAHHTGCPPGGIPHTMAGPLSPSSLQRPAHQARPSRGGSCLPSTLLPKLSQQLSTEDRESGALGSPKPDPCPPSPTPGLTPASLQWPWSPLGQCQAPVWQDAHASPPCPGWPSPGWPKPRMDQDGLGSPKQQCSLMQSLLLS